MPVRSSRLSRAQKVLILGVFSVFMTALVLGVLEVGCRIAGYGGYPPTFIEAGSLSDGSRVVFTDHGGPNSYFFASRSRGGSLDRTALVMPKPGDTTRIVIVGGSAAKGNPYPHPFTAGEFLEDMLEDVWPGRRVEVVNCGTTAVGAYPVLGIMTEALEYDADLVVIYTGNNEFYGAYGVASLHSAGRSPAMIGLIRSTRSLGIAQFIDQRLRPQAGDDGRTLMEKMVGRASIGPEDPARASAAGNLREFVGRMIARCRDRGVPVIVCTPPCNERGLAPLGEDDLSELAPQPREEVQALLTRAEAGMESDPEGTLESAESALAIMPGHARARWVRGSALFALGRFDEAHHDFALAVDLDRMPWRAPSASVEAVREAANSGGAMLCDLQAEFRRASPGGSIGWELMDDHVHASLRGQDLIARSIVRTLVGANGDLRVEASAVETLPQFEEYVQRFGWNPYSEYEAAHAMRLLGQIGFYQRSNRWFFERFDAVCARIEAHSRAEVVAEMRVWQDPGSHQGDWRPLAGMAGRVIYRLGLPGEAEPLFRVAAASVTPYSTWDLQYTTLMLSCRAEVQGGLRPGDVAEAQGAAERGMFTVKHAGLHTGEAERFTGELLQMCGRAAESVEYLRTASARLSGLDRVGAEMALVRALVGLGRADEAREVVNRGLRENPEFAGYYQRMSP